MITYTYRYLQTIKGGCADIAVSTFESFVRNCTVLVETVVFSQLLPHYAITTTPTAHIHVPARREVSIVIAKTIHQYGVPFRFQLCSLLYMCCHFGIPLW